ncbi:protein kinase domain-containing protein [Streptomyces sp. H51]|uniref:protein kinase domain-containing protein n=1 Tax=Streptomyces sp. H51 TaxID=3111770 RepID=UPI002D76993C|nr:protein kinase [Streptomyces sp. H51]
MTGRDEHTLVSADGRAVGDGRYVLQSLLGEGGMATVYLGHDTVLDRPVAVKLLRSDLAGQQAFRLRFIREAKAVASLNHTNIVSVFDSGEHSGQGAAEPYIVMEYVEGCSLRELLDQHVAESGAMPVPLALQITSEVLAALSESHARGLIHRDIKPANVMITRRNVVKVMDFGIARAMESGLGSMTQTGMVVGTPQYLSPEQAMGRQVDERSDLYSVGCMLFEMVTGRLPFDGDAPLTIAYQHVQAPAPVPSQVNASVPESVDRLIATALAKDPAQRHQSADAMREAVQALLAQIGPAGSAAPARPADSPGHPGVGQGNDSFGPPPAVGAPYMPTFAASAYPSQGAAAPASGGPAPMAVHPNPYQGTLPGGHAPQAPHRPSSPPRRKAVVWVASAAAVLVLGGLTVLTLGNGGKADDPEDVGPDKSASQPAASASASPSHGDVVMGDTSLTMPVKDCTKPKVSQDGKISVPWFKLHHIDSVRACAEAGGWKLTEKTKDEALWGKGIVVDQSPIGTQVDPDLKVVTVWVSTGVS